MQTGKKIDFCFIDGRISNEDCALFEKVFTEDAVIVIDDFEGVEKGVINVMMLRNKFPGHVLLEPPVHPYAKGETQFLRYVAHKNSQYFATTISSGINVDFLKRRK